MSGKRHGRQGLRAGALIAIVALAGAQGGCRRGSVVLLDGCRKSAWTPEVYTFYGSPDTVRAKLGGLDFKLAERRVYMYMVESSDSAELALFERPKTDSKSWLVWRWRGAPSEASKMLEAEAHLILKLQGRDCVGDATKELLKTLSPRQEETTTPPTTTEEAFGAAIERNAQQAKQPKDQRYIRATMCLLC
jgi:hypothetical protein